MFKSALIPVSFRERKNRLREMVFFLTGFGIERILLLHVVSGTRRERALVTLDRVASDLPGHSGDKSGIDPLRFETRVVTGSPASTIIRIAREEETDLVCVPWKRKSWLQRTLVGSTTRDIARLADQPVFIYKGGQRDSLATVLYGTALGSLDATVSSLIAGGTAPGVKEIILLHVGRRAPDPVAEHRRENAVRKKLEVLAETLGGAGSPTADDSPLIRICSATGSSRRIIPRVARREQVDLVVIGKAEARGSAAGGLGSTAEHVAYNARQSVLIVGEEIRGA